MEVLTVNQVSKKLQISVHTIRFYDDHGLFPGVMRDEHGKRLFTEESMEWAHLVLCLRNTGMSVADIKHFIELSKSGESTLAERYEIIVEQKKKAEADLIEAQNRLRAISGKEIWYKSLLEEKHQKTSL